MNNAVNNMKSIRFNLLIDRMTLIYLWLCFRDQGSDGTHFEMERGSYSVMSVCCANISSQTHGSQLCTADRNGLSNGQKHDK